MWTVQCTLYTVSTFLSSASSSSSVHDEILFYLERIKFLFISINIKFLSFFYFQFNVIMNMVIYEAKIVFSTFERPSNMIVVF